MKKYYPVIGLEIHIQLKTKSKMFCSCSAEYQNDQPNTHTCPVCLGLPGALPVANKKAIEEVVLMGLALNCQINHFSFFNRKNYFYPDLPKGYQITQYEKPFCHEGYLDITGKEFGSKRINIQRIHLEEDTGKSMHVTDNKTGEEYTLLDYNKSGLPLMELVTAPEFTSAEEVYEFAKKIRQIVRFLGISDGDMEKGQLRVEPNISLSESEEDLRQGILPKYKVEIKNLNSFTVLRKGVAFELDRQAKELDKGITPRQETRGFDEAKQATFSQRSKEEAHDYRYFPEPDLPPIEIFDTKKENKDGIYLDELQKQLPELPDAKKKRYQEDYGLNEYDAELLTSETDIFNWFELEIKDQTNKEFIKKITNWLLTQVLSYSKQKQLPLTKLLSNGPLTELVTLVESNKVSGANAKEVLEELIEKGGSVKEIVKSKGFEQVSDQGALESVVADVIAKNPQAVADFHQGKKQSMQFLIGQIMKATRGRADMKTVMPLLQRKLNSKKE